MPARFSSLRSLWPLWMGLRAQVCCWCHEHEPVHRRVKELMSTAWVGRGLGKAPSGSSPMCPWGTSRQPLGEVTPSFLGWCLRLINWAPTPSVLGSARELANSWLGRRRQSLGPWDPQPWGLWTPDTRQSWLSPALGAPLNSIAVSCTQEAGRYRKSFFRMNPHIHRQTGVQGTNKLQILVFMALALKWLTGNSSSWGSPPLRASATCSQTLAA